MSKYSKKVKQLTMAGIMFALAIALSYVENLIAAFLLLPPGVKLGIANVVVMYCFLFVGVKYAAVIVILKAVFALITRGAIAVVLSFSGGLLSFIALLIIIYVLKRKKDYFIFSVCSAIAHNLGQIIALSLFFNSVYTLYYIPVLLISGLGMGFLTSLSLRAVIPALAKL